MGIFDGFIDVINVDKWIRYNFESIYNDYKRRHPDVELWREHEDRPCPWYLYTVENNGQIYIEFFQSVAKQNIRFELLKSDENFKCAASVLNEACCSLPYHRFETT